MEETTTTTMTLGDIHAELRKLGFIGIFWGIEDVKQVAKDDYNTELSDEDAWDVLNKIEHHHDCNYGVTWDNIHLELEGYVGDRVFSEDEE